MELQEGDIFQVTTDRCIYLEVVKHPGGGWGWYSLIQRRDWPLSVDLHLWPAEKYLFRGNGKADPDLRERLKNIMEIDSWAHQAKPIPKLPQYQVAYKEWQRMYSDFESRKKGTYYNVPLNLPTGETAIVNILLFEKSTGNVWKVYFPGKEVLVNHDLTIELGQPLPQWYEVILDKIRELY